MKAVFLDRDGTINIDTGYVHRPEDFVFTHRAAEAIKLLNDKGYKVIVISNQSGISRGYYTLSDTLALHDHINAELAKIGAEIDAFYVCPHLPDGNCECRKPKPTLILRAAKRFDISLNDSWMIGDKSSDVECARNAGIRGAKIKSSDETESNVENCIEYDNFYDFVINLCRENR